MHSRNPHLQGLVPLLLNMNLKVLHGISLMPEFQGHNAVKLQQRLRCLQSAQDKGPSLTLETAAPCRSYPEGGPVRLAYVSVSI